MISASSTPHLAALLARERLPKAIEHTIVAAYEPLAAALARRDVAPTPWIAGLCGPQGSGKTTLARCLEALFDDRGIRAVVLSLDDFYATRRAREMLAARIHPLLATRGVPGTHDVALASQVLDALVQPGVVAIPTFDKASDDRKPKHEWRRIATPVQVVLFEGWCVGARPQSKEALATPVNALEREHDADGVWRRYVNETLGSTYQRLFERLDFLLMLSPPSFDVVTQWRIEQEHQLRARVAAERLDAAHLMSDAEVAEFVAHYERLTRHMLEEMPTRADCVLELDDARRLAGCPVRPT